MPPRSGTTAWTSDRIGIRPPPPKQKPEKGKGKTPAEPARSPAIRKLDDLLAGLRSSRPQHTTPDDSCFCQARTHQPSEYTPICTSCGLIICTLHKPYVPCPSCSSPLLDAAARAALVVQVEEKRESTLAEEEAERTRVAEELRLAEGEFPALGGGAGGAKTKRGARETGRVVREVGAEHVDVREPDVERVGPPESWKDARILRAATRWTVAEDGQGGAKYVA